MISFAVNIVFATGYPLGELLQGAISMKPGRNGIISYLKLNWIYLLLKSQLFLSVPLGVAELSPTCEGSFYPWELQISHLREELGHTGFKQWFKD